MKSHYLKMLFLAIFFNCNGEGVEGQSSLGSPRRYGKHEEHAPNVEPNSYALNTTPPPELLGIELINKQLTDKQLAELIEKGEFRSEFVEINLSSNQLGPLGVEILLSSSIKKIQTLILYDNKIGDNGIKLLAQSSKLRGINHLDISCNHITLEGLSFLMGPESFIQGTVVLNLSGNDYKDGDKAVEILISSLFPQNLQALILRKAKVTDAGAAMLAGTSFPRLYRLDISENSLSESGKALLQKSEWAKHCRITF